jgi:hypothetical protein
VGQEEISYCTDSLLNSRVAYCEQNYDTVMLVVLIKCKCLRKHFCALLVK